jgi:peptide chain release factor 2
VADLGALLELYLETEDDSLTREMEREYQKVDGEIGAFELTRLLSGPHDAHHAIVEINAGAGGVDSQDWAEMLLRMYLRWAEQRGYPTQLLDSSAGDEAGIRSATLYVEGPQAYGYLRSERGVHRLVRISPFDQNERRHTSFASVSVMPDVEADVEIEVRDEDLRIDTYRASGAGGQHVNKTDSAVRLTHLPSGIVVACQSQRSQHNNKSAAMKVLKAKLYEREMAKRDEEMKQIAGVQMKIDFGSQIRSYVLHPYQMVKDLRTDAETGNVQAVLDGDLDLFIESYLLSEEHNAKS